MRASQRRQADREGATRNLFLVVTAIPPSPSPFSPFLFSVSSSSFPNGNRNTNRYGTTGYITLLLLSLKLLRLSHSPCPSLSHSLLLLSLKLLCLSHSPCPSLFHSLLLSLKLPRLSHSLLLSLKLLRLSHSLLLLSLTLLRLSHSPCPSLSHSLLLLSLKILRLSHSPCPSLSHSLPFLTQTTIPLPLILSLSSPIFCFPSNLSSVPFWLGERAYDGDLSRERERRVESVET